MRSRFREIEGRERKGERGGWWRGCWLAKTQLVASRAGNKGKVPCFHASFLKKNAMHSKAGNEFADFTIYHHFFF